MGLVVDFPLEFLSHEKNFFPDFDTPEGFVPKEMWTWVEKKTQIYLVKDLWNIYKYVRKLQNIFLLCCCYYVL